MSRRLLPLLFLATLGCGGKPSPETKPEPPPAPPTAAVKPSADPNAPSADATFTYWQAVGKVQEVTARKYAALADPKPEVVNPLLTAAAKGIDDLPTEKVDPDAVAVGKGLSEALRKLADKTTDVKGLMEYLSDAAGKARKMKATLSARHYREFPDLTSTDKEPAFRIARDLGRPTLAQELARLKAESAKFDVEIKPLGDKLSADVTTRDMLQSQADGLRTTLKNQTEDADLKKVREDVLADAVKDLEVMKKEIDAQTKTVNGLRAKKGELDRLVMEVTGVLTEGEPEKAEKLPPDRLDRLRVQADRVFEKLVAPKK